jgi:hypothetical protein
MAALAAATLQARRTVALEVLVVFGGCCAELPEKELEEWK